MNNKSSKHLRSLEEQYEVSPYPHVPIEKSNKGENYNNLFINDLTTPYYLLTQKKISRQNKTILDVGCGSGWTSLSLAEANPEAEIICVDLSASSLQLAKQRLAYHGFVDNVKFYQLPLEDITQLDYRYDYICCKDVLYFSANPIESLKALQSVLKPNGIIRGNLHSYYQRFDIYRAQSLFKCLGLMDENPEDFALEVVVETMKNLKDQVNLKRTAGLNLNYNSIDLSKEKTRETLFMNHLIQKDKGYTIPQMFQMLRESDLSFLSMTNWRQWQIRDLFKDKDDLPFVWEVGLENASEEEKLHLFELLHPIHRLLDFWCYHQNDGKFTNLASPIMWSMEQWKSATVSLHPQLQCEQIKANLIQSIEKREHWEISKYITLPSTSPIYIDSHSCAAILYFWDRPQTVDNLVQHWLNIKPIDLVTLEPTQNNHAWKEVIDLLVKLETFLYVLIDKN